MYKDFVLIAKKPHNEVIGEFDTRQGAYDAAQTYASNLLSKAAIKNWQDGVFAIGFGSNWGSDAAGSNRLYKDDRFNLEFEIICP